MRLCHIISVSSAACLAACAQVPDDLGSLPAVRSASSLPSVQSLAGEPGEWPADKWWQAYGDTQLNALIDEALAGSPDVTIAAARVRGADALAQQSRAALGPALDAQASGGGIQQSQNLGVPRQFVPDGIQDTGRLAAAASFDLDLWGRNRAALSAATSETQAVRVDAAQSRLVLTTSVASAYADLAQLYRSRAVAVDALRVREATSRLTAERVAVGVDTRGSLRQAESRVPVARSDISAIDESILLTRHRLAALLGAGPDRGLAIAVPRLRAVLPSIPANAGIELVGRRPDIVAARLRAEAAATRIKVARADFYPNVNLTALVGLQSLGIGQLLNSGSTIANGGAAFTLPIFDGGRIAGRYRGARASYDEAVARYDATLVTALRDVADTIASRNATAARIVDLKRATAAADEAANIAVLRYRGGLSNQLQVLVSADAVLANRRALADLEARQMTLDVALIRALGGGYGATTIARTN